MIKEIRKCKECRGCGTIFQEICYSKDVCNRCGTELSESERTIIITEVDDIAEQHAKINKELYGLYVKDNEENLKKYKTKLEYEEREEREMREFLASMREETEIRCPVCGSAQVTSTKKGFSLGKAAAGGLLLGGIGLLGGLVGSNKVMLNCLSCGHQFKPNQN